MTTERPDRPKTWRDEILREFTPEMAAVSKLTIVSDPDQLFADPGVIEEIRRRGFDVVTFDDHVKFRFEFETRYRRMWDLGVPTTLVVLLRTDSEEVEKLPFDLLDRARRADRVFRFPIGRIFPNLDPGVIAELDRSDFDSLWDAQAIYQPEKLGEDRTRDFVLANTFKLHPAGLQNDADLLQMLIALHYKGARLPAGTASRLVEIVRRRERFNEWPIARLLGNRELFYRFLEERWPAFLRRQPAALGEPPGQESSLAISGPRDLPFDHPGVRVYLDNLFAEGLLEPFALPPGQVAPNDWTRVGIRIDEPAEKLARFERLTGIVRSEIPDSASLPATWMSFAPRWAEWLVLREALSPTQLDPSNEEIAGLISEVDSRFEAWMLERYRSLHNASFLPRPLMVQQIPRFLAHERPTPPPGIPLPKQALVVIDGLAFSQWLVLRSGLAGRLGDVDWDESGVFAWVPTLTSVSRQSIFAGVAPFFFASDIGTTAREEYRWRSFWENNGLRSEEVAFVVQGEKEDGAFLEAVRTHAEHPKRKVLGLVVSKIDQMMHGAVHGSRGMLAVVQKWSDDGFLGSLLEALLAEGWSVTITADHGNREAIGIGGHKTGKIADTRGERVLVFDDEATLRKFSATMRGTVAWPPHGLPERYFPLLASGDGAFVQKDSKVVAHGGASLEEVIVPFVRIQPRRGES